MGYTKRDPTILVWRPSALCYPNCVSLSPSRILIGLLTIPSYVLGHTFSVAIR
jgi:hypothetical protein